MPTTANLQLNLLTVGQQGAEQMWNDTMNRIDAAFHVAVISELTTPPGSPSDGDMYIIGTGGTGDWSGHDDEITYYYDGWNFFPLTNGLRYYNIATTQLFIYAGSWKRVPISVADVSDLDQDISATYVEAEVQAISDKVDETLASLRAAGVLV